MKERLDKILSNKDNFGLEFVVHIKNKNEFDDLNEVLNKYNFNIEFKLFEETLTEWMNRLSKEDNYNTCFRIGNYENKVVAYNPSIEHWRLYCKDIIEFKDNDIVFNEGIYTEEEAKIEADYIISDIKDGSYLKNIYDNMSKEEIVNNLISKK